MGSLSTAAPEKGTVAEVDVHGISSRGAGVGRLEDGRAVFVPRTAPGDRVRLRLTRVKPRWAEGTLLEVLEPSPDRREPLCTRYDVCGGCQLQHLPEDVQRAWKRSMVVEAFDRIGGLGRVDVPEVVASPEPVRYRNRMSFTLRRLRGGRVVAGLHGLERPGHVVEIHDECVLPEEPIERAWIQLRQRWGPGARALPDGGRLRLTLRVRDDGGVGLIVSGGDASWRPATLMDAVPELSSVVHEPDEGSPSPGFEQVNSGAAELLRAHVMEEAGEAATVVDAYCGVGPYGRALAARGADVIGIEMDPEAVERAEVDAPAGFRVRTGKVERVLPELSAPDALILNPPRTGVDDAVVETVLDTRPRRLVYVSCDPATLARDLSGLASAYEVARVRCFDLFPQTAHVETVVTMNLSRGG